MTDEPDRPPPSAGLCHACRHARVVRSERGSEFTLCRLSRTDPRFPKYPRLPVVACEGHEPRLTSAEPDRATRR
jgi:hypothetical protein